MSRNVEIYVENGRHIASRVHNWGGKLVLFVPLHVQRGDEDLLSILNFRKGGVDHSHGRFPRPSKTKVLNIYNNLYHYYLRLFLDCNIKVKKSNESIQTVRYSSDFWFTSGLLGGGEYG